MTARSRVLVVGESGRGRLLGEPLVETFDVARAPSVAAAVDAVRSEPFECVLICSPNYGEEVEQGLSDLQAADPALAIVILSERSDDEGALTAVTAGAQDYLVASETEPQTLLRAIRHSIERKRVEGRLSYLAMHDALTGLPNRALFMDRARLALARARRRPMSVAVLFIDLDRFKLVNDSFSHQAGDRVLIEAAARFSKVLRPSDSVARTGGDEFVVLCEELRAPRDAEVIASRIQAVLSEPFEIDGNEVHLSASIGIAVAGSAADSPEELLRNADTAMYRAKESQSSWELFDSGMRADLASRLTLQAELHGALQRSELTLHYQPLIELAPAPHVIGVEALLRWRHADNGLMLPKDFMSIVEHSKLILPIGRWVLEEGLEQLAQWEAAAGADDLLLSVNVSARQFEDRAFAKNVAVALQAIGVDPSRLCLELTETAVMVHPEEAARRMHELKELGVKLAIDDFGTGYTSLSQLSRLPVDILKIDRSFVTGVATARDKHSVVSAIVSLAGSLGIMTLAEGVESAADEAALTELGCQLAQGHRYSKARSPLELAQEGLIGSPAVHGLGAAAAERQRPEREAIRVVLADDVAELRALMRLYLEQDRSIGVVGEASDGDEAVRTVIAERAEVILLDLSMPNGDGLQAISRLREVTPEIGIIVLSGFEATFMESRTLALGADRYLEKGTSLEAVRRSIHEVANQRLPRNSKSHASARLDLAIDHHNPPSAPGRRRIE